MDDVLVQIANDRLIAVIRAENSDEALRSALRAADAGISVIEVAWTTPNADRVLQALKGRVPWLGAGTILRTEQAMQATAAGAQFLISPSFSAAVGRFAQEQSLLYIPGVCTPRDVAEAIDAGFHTLKLFPAGVLGISYLQALQAPFPHLQWIPTGGVHWDTVADWLRAGVLAVGMGAALFRVDHVADAVSAVQRRQV